jgi:peptide-methionine (R)-S-oxide reductase
MKFYIFSLSITAIIVMISCTEKPLDNNDFGVPFPKSIDPEDSIQKIKKTDEEWREILTPLQYEIMRKKGTERAYTGAYWNHKEKGTYYCAGCNLPLFSSDAKYDSGCGWPSFTAPIGETNIGEEQDNSFGMRRTEVVCNRCEAHLGHVFEDGPLPTGLRYCINSEVFIFKPE